MYTFVYRTFIKFILFCRGQALDVLEEEKRLSNEETVSMPSRAYASLLQYPFKNLCFMRFPEPVFAGICQNILTVTVFRAC